MPVPVNTGLQGPSNFDKFKMGAMMGGTVGVIIGFIYGTVNIFRYGAGTTGIMRTLGQYMAASGATFGFFMSIGSVIRSDAGDVVSPVVQQAYLHARQKPWIMAADAAYRPRRSE
ncbi:subunit of TIM23 translocase complex [Sporothrix eucalyptigena]|uniref:Subunit of TIM23 translocase complex n=1 Tax=Sporothrix eucalyptigena TaxID=1812306 RepID=A0ABP0BTS7_9PEZI